MTAPQESPVDLERIKQAFVEILLRRRAEQQQAEDDVLESVAALFDEADAGDGLADDDLADDDLAEDGTGAAAGAAGAADVPGAAGAPGTAGAPAAAGTGGDSPQWQHFLYTYGPEWNGKKEAWGPFRLWVEHFAKAQGLSFEATRFLNAAEAETDLAARIKFFAGHGVQIDAGGKAPEADNPTTDADGRDVDMVLSSKKEKDGGGEYLWVRVAGEAGKIYLDGRKFIAEANPKFDGIPTADDRGRKISQVQDAKAGTDYMVLINHVWGRLDPKTRKFTALRVDESGYADWSTRTILEDGYREGATTVSGTWYKPWADQNVYVFWRGENDQEWARGDRPAGNMQGGVAQTVATVLKEWAQPLAADRL